MTLPTDSEVTLPTNPAPAFPARPLTILPRAVRVYTDFRRMKPASVVMTYRRRNMAEGDARRWADEIRADLTRAGYAPDQDAQPAITPTKGAAKPGRPRFDFLFEIPVGCPENAKAEGPWAEAAWHFFVGGDNPVAVGTKPAEGGDGD